MFFHLALIISIKSNSFKLKPTIVQKPKQDVNMTVLDHRLFDTVGYYLLLALPRLTIIKDRPNATYYLTVLLRL